MANSDQLTPHQQQVFNQIQAFLGQDGPGVFILKGYAGVGKTFLLQYLAGKLQKEKKNFTLLASTGRAASVLRAKTEFAATTVHSELYKFDDVDGDEESIPDDAPNEDFGQMKLLFDLRTPDRRGIEKVYIVDETSMISNVLDKTTSFAKFGSGHLLDDFMKAVGHNKIIFTGDPAQLPPVLQHDSPTLSPQWFKKRNYSVMVGVLSQIIRQKQDSPILRLATRVRKLAQQTEYPDWVKLPSQNIAGIYHSPYQNMLTRYQNYTTAHGFDNAIAICHSNRHCQFINGYIREHRFGVANLNLQIGDILMVTQNNYLVPLVNGDFVEVTQLSDYKTQGGFRFQEIRVKAKHNQKEYQVLLSLDALQNTKGNLSQHQQRDLMIDFARRMRKNGIKRKSSQYKEALQEDPYLNSLRASYGYAVTCHKSQGGEWDHVFFFLQKGMYIMNKQHLYRWWYTGITRAKKKLYLVDDWWIG